MTTVNPNLMTLLSWADRLADGKRCAEWETWCGSSPAAAGTWEKVTAAQDRLAGGTATNPDLAIDAEELAALIEGRLDPSAAQPAEMVCWQSTEQLAEALSAARFHRRSEFRDVPTALTRRLLVLAPPPQNGHAARTPRNLHEPAELAKADAASQL